jgi:hypothetical protein
LKEGGRRRGRKVEDTAFWDISLEDGMTKQEPSALGYNCATLFLGDINTGTWHFRLTGPQFSKLHFRRKQISGQKPKNGLDTKSDSDS